MNEQKPKHTPGPWQVAENGFGVYASDPHFVVANTWTTYGMLISQQEELDAIQGTQRANAHLLAASLLMLEALREVEWVLDEEYGVKFCPSCQEWRNHRHKDDCKLDAAIKAALNLD